MATSTLRTESPNEGIDHVAIGDPLRPGHEPGWRSGWTALVVSALCRGALAMLAALLLWAVLPAAFGWPVTVVMSGSMEPLLRPGDIVASRPISADAVRPGQILLVNDPDHAGRLRLHRLAVIRPDGMLTLRGDANSADDSTPVRRSAVHGLGSLKVPVIGLPAYWARTHQIGALAGSAAALGLLIGGAWLRRDEEDTPDDDVDGDTGPSDGPGSELGTAIPSMPSTSESDIRRVAFTSRSVRRAGIGMLTIGLVGAGIASGPVAFATPFGAATSTSSTWTAASTFSGCGSAAMTNTPYAYYPLTETSGTTASDTSGNGRNATYGTGVTHTPGGGPCSDTPAVASFNGSGMISTAQPITFGASFTEQIWFNTFHNQGGSLIGLAGTPTGSVSDPQLYLNNATRLVFEVSTTNGGAATVTDPTKYRDGDWHLATATLSSAGMKLYVDGQLVASDGSTTTMTASVGYLQMGNGFSGSLSGGALFATALSAAQIQAEYQPRA